MSDQQSPQIGSQWKAKAEVQRPSPVVVDRVANTDYADYEPTVFFHVVTTQAEGWHPLSLFLDQYEPAS